MTGLKLRMQALKLGLLCPLVFGAVFGLNSHAMADSGHESAANFYLKGVLVSNGSRSALVNNTILREGEQLGSIEILAIAEGEVRVRRGSQQRTVLVGSRAAWDLATRYTPPAPTVRTVQSDAASSYGPVQSGETLSGIAASLSRDGATMNQVMIALFEANPQAFVGNINILQEGVVLQIPNEAALLRHSHETATAAVVQHMDTWRQDSVQQLQSANTDANAPGLHDTSMRPPDTILVSMQGSR